MNYKEALEWLKGKRSMTNILECEDTNSWNIAIAQADAAMTEQAYWIVRAHKEGLVKGLG